MADGLGTLGDLFPEKNIACCVRGCNNLIAFSGDEAMRQAADGTDEKRQMCEDCYALFRELADRDVQCSKPGCTGTWTWRRYQQLEAKRRGFKKPPDRLCEACQKRMAEVGDKKVPCRVRGCENTWTWTAAQRVRAGEEEPPARFCEQCFRRFKDLADREVPCRMKGCERTWTWKRFHQLEHLAAGNTLDDPPRRMCAPCFARLRQLEDKQLPCKADECERTWLWNTYAQVEHELANGPDAEPPSKLCPECYRFFRSTRDREVRCRNRGCKNTWTYTRGMQLHGWLSGEVAPPPHMCDECREWMEQAEPKEIECMVPGCSETWTYSPLDQVRDRAQRRKKPNPRRCQRCTEFLAAHQPETLVCSECGSEFVWSSYEQLLNHLGRFAQPTRCAQCAENRLAAKSEGDLQPTREHHHIVRMPAAGKWMEDARISAWPPHLTHDDLEEAERAATRIVALGDDLVCSREEPEAAWPTKLEGLLNQKRRADAAVKVINAGMPRTTSAQGRMRLRRDVAPFDPALVLVSFALADSRLWLNERDETWRPAPFENDPDALDRLLADLQPLCQNVVYVVLNPVLPMTYVENHLKGRCTKWADAQDHMYKQCVAHHTRLCRNRSVPVVDLRPQFEVNGRRSTRKWLDDWHLHNNQGAENIAVWLRDALLRHKALP